MRREYAVIGMIICIVGGAFAGWLIPGLISDIAGGNLVQRILNRQGEGGQPYIIIGTSADYPPFEDYYTNNDTFYGFDIDLCEMIAEELGVYIEWKDLDFDSLIGACRGGAVDMLAAAMTYNAERAQKLSASLTYINVSQVVIANDTYAGPSISSLADLAALGNDQVGCQSGTTLWNDLTAAISPTTAAPYASADILVKDLAETGTIQAGYVDEPVFTAWSATYNLQILYSSGTESFSLFCRQKSADLLFVINKVIFESFQDGRMFDLYNKWFNVTS